MQNFYLKDFNEDNQKLIPKHTHKFKKELTHSCGECMYYKNTKDGRGKKLKWCKKLEKKYGPCCKVIMKNDTIIGFTMFVPKKELHKLESLSPGSTNTDAWYIPCIFISKDHANKREEIETFVVHEILKILKTRDAQKVQIFGANTEKNSENISTSSWDMYEKLGFNKIWKDEEITVGEILL